MDNNTSAFHSDTLLMQKTNDDEFHVSYARQILEIRARIGEQASSRKFKAFTDITDTEQNEEYNRMLTESHLYFIDKEDGSWKGTSNRNEKYTMLVWYREVDPDLYNDLMYRTLKKLEFEEKLIEAELWDFADNYVELINQLYNKGGGSDEEARKAPRRKTAKNSRKRTGDKKRDKKAQSAKE